MHGLVGSPFYIAPEVLAGAYNQAADVWSAGVILYILLSGTPPFWGKTKSRIFEAVKAASLKFPLEPWDRISESAKDLIKGMLCTDPSRRLTAQEVLGKFTFFFVLLMSICLSADVVLFTCKHCLREHFGEAG